MQSSHFKTDNFEQPISKPKKESKDRPKKKPTVAQQDEDDELKRAIELSKKTAEKEERERIKSEQEKIKAKESKPAADADEFDFGAGFEKFATGQ